MAPLKIRSREEAARLGLLRERPKASDPPPLSQRIDRPDPFRKPGRGAKAERRPTDTPGTTPARDEPGRDRRGNRRRRAKLGGAVGDSSQPFTLDLSPAPVLDLDVGLVVGQSAGPGAHRTLLAGVALPLPPSVNNYWNSQVVWSEKHKRNMSLRYVSTEGKEYQSRLRAILLSHKAWFRSPHPLAMRLLVCPKSNNRQDISNRIKVLEDCMKSGNVFEDDSQIETLEVRRGPLVTGGAVYVRLVEFLPNRQNNLAWIREEWVP